MTKYSPLRIEGLWLIEFEIHSDNRGEFREWFKSSELQIETGINFIPVQANISKSFKGVIRGIHASRSKNGQSKLITCSSGKLLDVVVDLRPKSKTFGLFESVELSPGSGRALFISHGLGHAFQALEDETSICYLVSSEYNPEFEFAINPLDPELGIDWPLRAPILSDKDSKAPPLKSLSSQFI